MTTKSEVFDDGRSVANAPPPYSTSSPSLLWANAIQCIKPSIFPWLRVKQSRTIVLSCIRDIVSAPDFDSSSIVSAVDTCVAALSAVEFSDLLQTPNIEGHTALYWAIVNNRREAYSVFALFISKISSVCSSDLRRACMVTSDHALFMQLDLGNANSKDEPFRRSLGCPADVIQVDEADGRPIVASFHLRMFQKRLRIARELRTEFVAGGRIWWLRFYLGPEGKWNVGFGLSQHSFPTQLHVLLLIESHGGKPVCATPSNLRLRYDHPGLLVPEVKGPQEYTNTAFDKNSVDGHWILSDWLMDESSIYVDCHGTLHAKLEITLRGRSRNTAARG
ncbi:hypothetical protein DFH29DRAFT_933961 [Suillus ampliporus]|nr:hypothetical protein DFH29DRAFT_933961 [Suillus ampliporus]